MAIELIPLLTESGPPDEPPAGYSPPSVTTSQELAEWASEYLDANNPDLRASSLPKQNNDWLRSIWSALTSPDGVVRTLFAGVEAAVDLIRGDVEGFVDAVETQYDAISAALGHTPATPTVIERLDTISAGGGNAWWGTVPFDPTNPEWVLVGTDTFTDFTHFVEEGHVYVVTAIPPITARSTENIDGETVYFGLGWWAEMAGDFRGQRAYLDFEENLCHREGHLMRGCMVNLPKGGDGQISAYRFTPTP